MQLEWESLNRPVPRFRLNPGSDRFYGLFFVRPPLRMMTWMGNQDREFRRGRLLERRLIHSGKVVDLVVDRLESEGREYVREVVRHPGGVVVIGELENGGIPFVRQLRYPMDRVLLELPAGKLDPGEVPEVGAAREFEEETGYRPLRLERVLDFYSSPGFCDELLYLFHSDSLQRVSRKLGADEDEDLDLVVLDLEEAIAMAARGEILDAKSLVALYWLDWKKKR